MLCHRILLAFILVSALFPAKPAPAEDAFRPPAVPLVACDPYFSIWSRADHLYDTNTTHWTGKPHRLTALLRVDGKSYRLMGDAPDDLPVMRQTSVEVLPTRTVYTFSHPDVTASLTFMTPALPGDLMILSRPTTYVTCEVCSTDGKKHQVEFYFDAGGELASNTLDQAGDRLQGEVREGRSAEDRDGVATRAWKSGRRPADRLGLPLSCGGRQIGCDAGLWKSNRSKTGVHREGGRSGRQAESEFSRSKPARWPRRPP